jgi:hypothetical protein
MDKNIEGILASVNFIKDRMLTKDEGATKDDVRVIVRGELRDELRPIHSEISQIRRDFDDLRDKVENIVGYRKEIDHGLERIAAIEKHLGIKHDIAA